MIYNFTLMHELPKTITFNSLTIWTCDQKGMKDLPLSFPSIPHLHFFGSRMNKWWIFEVKSSFSKFRNFLGFLHEQVSNQTSIFLIQWSKWTWNIKSTHLTWWLTKSSLGQSWLWLILVKMTILPLLINWSTPLQNWWSKLQTYDIPNI